MEVTRREFGKAAGAAALFGGMPLEAGAATGVAGNSLGDSIRRFLSEADRKDLISNMFEGLWPGQGEKIVAEVLAGGEPPAKSKDELQVSSDVLDGAVKIRIEVSRDVLADVEKEEEHILRAVRGKLREEEESISVESVEIHDRIILWSGRFKEAHVAAGISGSGCWAVQVSRPAVFLDYGSFRFVPSGSGSYIPPLVRLKHSWFLTTLKDGKLSSVGPFASRKEAEQSYLDSGGSPNRLRQMREVS